MVKVAGKQSLGKRERQEDAFKLVFQDEADPGSDLLMLVSDGMGGHAGGEVASNLACNVFGSHFVSHATATRPRPRLEQSLHAANSALADKIAQEPGLKGMGCTLIAALKIDDRLSWVSVGDSVMFLLRGGQLSRLNADHSVYGELMDMVRAGTLTQAEADRHPKRNALRSAVTGKSISLVDLEGIDLRTGDLVVIATDGLETIPDAEIAQILEKEERPDVRAVCSDLLNAVEGYGKATQDNTTVVVYSHASCGRTSSARSQWTSSGTEPSKPQRSRASLPIIGAVAAIGLAVLATLIWMAIRPAPPPPEPAEITTPDAPSTPKTPRGPRAIEGERSEEEPVTEEDGPQQQDGDVEPVPSAPEADTDTNGNAPDPDVTQPPEPEAETDAQTESTDTPDTPASADTSVEG